MINRSDKWRYLGLSVLWTLLATGFTSLSCAEDVVLSWSGYTMGPITYVVKVVAPSEVDLTEVQNEISSVLDCVNHRMSTYLPDSEVSRFNKSESPDWFEVSPQTAVVISRAQEISRITNGAFDITVKPIVERWNMGAGKQDTFTVPSAEETARLKLRIGFEKLDVRIDPPAIRKVAPDLQIDLSAIAKGYAVDSVSEKLQELGFVSHFVEIGGEVRAHGMKPNEQPWIVGIERPIPNIRETDCTVVLKNQALATSGDYRNFVEVGGKRRSHTIDPRTGTPVENSMVSASVLASDCMTADAYATAFMVLGPEEIDRVSIAESLGVYLIQQEGSKLQRSFSGEIPFQEAPPSEASEAASTIFPLFLAAFVLFGLAVLGMASGVILSNRTIKGSCGGISGTTNPDGSTSCSVCQNPASECRDKQAN
ncbi:MAG: FAD:protein FMN transferase [Pirellulaceae bacterium]|nr:FAD:protein FMN transferase [Pirellulaceae bacterium]